MIGEKKEADVTEREDTVIDMEFIYEHQRDSEWAERLLNNYEEIINTFSDDQVPEACGIMSATIGGYAYNLPPGSLLDDCNVAALRIIRTGLNAMRTTKVDG